MDLNGKVVSAFVAGAVIASGIVYMAVKPGPEALVAKRLAETSPQPVVAEPTKPAPVAPPANAATQAPPLAPPPIRRAPIREKPSPMPPPVRHEAPIIFARNQEPELTTIQPPTPQTNAAETAAPVNPSAPVPSAPVPPAPSSLPPGPPATPAPAAPQPEVRVPHMVTLTAGTMLPVRIGETISSARSQPGDSFLATLDQQLVLDGFIIADRGSRVEGRVVEVDPAGRVRGVSHLAIELVRISTTDGQHVRIRTEPYKKDGPTSTTTDAAKVGGGAAIGAIIGAIAGGGKGAAIGAGAGGALGAGDVLLTRGKPVEIPVETRLTFRVQDPVTITEKLN